MLTDDEKRTLDAAAAALYHISQTTDGMKSIDLHAGFMDTNEDLLQLAYDLRPTLARDPSTLALSVRLHEKIAKWYDPTIAEIQSDILKKAGYDPACAGADDAKSYLLEEYQFQIPYSHYLNQRMQVNLMLESDADALSDFTAISDQYQAIAGLLPEAAADAVLQKKTALRWLVEQQGYTMSDLVYTFQSYQECMYGTENKTLSDNAKLSFFNNFHSFFLSSVCQELENTVNSMNTLTVLSDLSMYDYCELLQPGKELVLPCDTVLGLFSPWQGGGSMFAIRLEKELIIPSEMIWDIQVEDTALLNQRSVDSIYGMPEQAWKRPLAMRTKPVSLDAALKDAADTHMQNDPAYGRTHRQDPER